MLGKKTERGNLSQELCQHESVPIKVVILHQDSTYDSWHATLEPAVNNWEIRESQI